MIIVPDAIKDISSHGYAVGVGNFSTLEVETDSTYREDWIDLYAQNKWMAIDPIVKTGVKVAGCTTWEDSAPVGSKVLDAASDFGMTDGLILSTNIGGNQCILGLSTRSALSSKSKDEAVRSLYQSHLSLLKTRARDLSPSNQLLMMLAGNGLQGKEIAHELDIKYDAIKARKATIVRKLGVRNFYAALHISTLAGITIHTNLLAH